MLLKTYSDIISNAIPRSRSFYLILPENKVRLKQFNSNQWYLMANNHLTANEGYIP